MPDCFYRLRALFKKELVLLLKNPKSRFTLFLPPLIQLLVLGYAATMDRKVVDFGVLDHADSAESRALVAKFTGNGVFLLKRYLYSERDLADAISTRRVKAALVIPENFTASLNGKADPVVQLIVDGRNSSTAALIQGYAANVIELFNQSRLGGAPSVIIQSRAWFNPNYSAQYFMVPALLATIALLDLMMLSAMSLAREREDGTIDQLLLTPYSPLELLLMKGASTMFVGLCQLTAGLLMALFWFQIPFMGSFTVLYTLFFAFLFASVGLGMLLSVVSKDLNQAMMATFLVAIPFATLSGMATPIESMPDILQKVTIINPVRYGVKSLQQIFLEGVGFAELTPTFLLLAAIGAGGFLSAMLLFRRSNS